MTVEAEAEVVKLTFKCIPVKIVLKVVECRGTVRDELRPKKK